MPRDTRRPPIAPPLVFVDDLDEPRLAPNDAHHLGRVLRLREGTVLTLADGHGAWRPAVYRGTAVKIVGGTIDEPLLDPPITIAFALTKGDKPELVVQKLTELGADVIVGFAAARSIVRWDDAKLDRQLERWRSVARQAAMQCRRARLPLVEPPTCFEALVARPDAALASPDGDAPSLAASTVLIGPEGGWAPEESAAARRTVAFADHVLRAETAAITACSVLAALRSRLAGEMSHPASS